MDLVTMILACSLYNDNSIINAIIQTGSQNNALMITRDGSNPTVFPTIEKAISYANAETQQGHTIDVGVMQIPSRWFTQYHVTPADLLRPCKNIEVGSRILLDLQQKCSETPGPTTCALSTYKTGDATAGEAFAENIIKFAQLTPFVAPENTLFTPTKPPTKTIIKKPDVQQDTLTVPSTANAKDANTETDTPSTW